MNFPLSRSLLALAAFCMMASPLPMKTATAETVKDGTPRYVTTKLIPEFSSIVPGQTLTIAIDQTMVNGWHTYWKNPGDSGEATNITWTLPDGWSAGAITYPTPQKEQVGPLMNYGYAHHVTLLTTLNVPEKISGDTVPVNAQVTWLTCSDICVPETTTINMSLPVAKDGAEPQPTSPDLFDAARKAMPEQAAWQGMVEEQDKHLVLSFRLEPDTLATLKDAKDVYFFPEDWGIILYAPPQVVTTTNTALEIKAERDTRPLSDITSLKGVLAYTLGNGEQKSIAIDIPLAKENVATLPAKSLDLSMSLAGALFLAFIGGMILNLMPCVFPVLSMKALSLIKMSEREQKHANLHGLFYTAGILICFVAIAGLLIALQATGEQIGWGFQLQNPVVVLLLTYLLFVMGLNLSGYFEFKGHLFSNIGHKLAAHHGYKGTFFTGMLATIVATPCTAPFMGTAMGYALTQPPIAALSVFVALGLGLAAPYLLLCFVPPLRKSLPKPGAWMETFRQFMAFPLYASVAWLVWVYAQQVASGYGALLALSGLLLIAFSVWVVRHTPHIQPWKMAVKALSFLCLVVALLIAGLSNLAIDKTPATQNEMGFAHTPFTKQAYDTALAGNDPVFVDMTAAWCITCKVNEKMALATDATAKLFADKHVQVFVGDWTNKNAEITEFLRSYGRSGVPLYVYVGPRDKGTGTRPDPKVLPQLLTNGIIADTVSPSNLN